MWGGSWERGGCGRVAEGAFSGEESVDGVKGGLGKNVLVEEGLKFLFRGDVSIYTRRHGGVRGGRTFFMFRRERLVSMTCWRSAETMTVGDVRRAGIIVAVVGRGLW